MKFLVFILLVFPFFVRGQSHFADSLIQKSSLEKTVSFLSADKLKGRFTGSEGATEAATFIANTFEALGLVPLIGKQSFYDSFPADNYDKKIVGVNVIGSIPSTGANDTMIIFSAHYDHIGQANDLATNKDYSKKDDIYNGANDNATGVAAMLELAKYYAAKKHNRYNLVFIGFAGEELGMVGSTHLADSLDIKIIKAVINLEMLGRPAYNNCYIISLGNNKVRNRLNSHLKKVSLVEKNFFGYDPYSDEDLAHRSDHYPFAVKINDAFTIMASSPKDRYYHTVDDTFETIDFDFLLKATRLIATATEDFTN
ncbi:M28 family metallopeptidase [soil metagenome]